MIRRPPRSTRKESSAASDVYKRQGLSGTGKTTLSADPNRQLVGDDEHGWSKNQVFNFEGGCYAKVINLNKESEPDIYKAIKKGSLLENIIADKNGKVDFTDTSITQNTRVSYPINFIENIKYPSIGSTPKNIFFLTADAFGVLPPISKLSSSPVSYTHLRAHETLMNLVCRLLLEKKNS